MLDASLGPAQHHRNLTIFPVLADKDRELPYGLMAEALAMGILTIGEKDGGEVPLLLATNTGIHPILILDGEQLIGAKQNRMTNRSIILPPNSITQIPVSCMEQGRWDFQGDKFAPAPQHAPTKVRRKARETEARATYAAEGQGPESRPSYRDLSSAQGEVWEEIRTLGTKLGGTSPTGALDSIFAGRLEEMNRWKTAFPLLPHQIGLLAIVGEAVLGMDAIGSPSLYGKIHDRMLTGYIMDAMERRGEGSRVGRRPPDQAPPGHAPPGQAPLDQAPPGQAPLDQAPPGQAPLDQAPPGQVPPIQQPLAGFAERFIENVATTERTPSESVGMGEYRVLRGKVLGGELANDGHLVHVSAFPTVEGGQAGNDPSQTGRYGSQAPEAGPIARPSQRKKRF